MVLCCFVLALLVFSHLYMSILPVLFLSYILLVFIVFSSVFGFLGSLVESLFALENFQDVLVDPWYCVPGFNLFGWDVFVEAFCDFCF